MKKLLFIPLLFAFYIAIAQTTNPSSIIGNPIKIGNLLIAQYDFQDDMNWDDAKAACEALGKGWRLPSKIELNTLYLNKARIGGFFGKEKSRSYWSNTEVGVDYAWCMDFYEKYIGAMDKTIPFSVRAVRSL